MKSNTFIHVYIYIYNNKTKNMNKNIHIKYYYYDIYIFIEKSLYNFLFIGVVIKYKQLDGNTLYIY